MPAGEDAMSLCIRHLRDPVADAFEARLISWLGANGIQPVFAMGMNGYWIISGSASTLVRRFPLLADFVAKVGLMWR